MGRIGSLAFFDCPNLQRIYIPSTVGWIESQAFSDDVSSTVTIYYGGTSEEWVRAFSAEENPVLMACAIEFQATGLGTDVSSVAAPQGRGRLRLQDRHAAGVLPRFGGRRQHAHDPL